MALSILRLAYGAVLIAVLFVPFGVYHTGFPYVTGVLWGFMLPIGYVSAASGAMMILYSRSDSLKRLGFGNLLLLSGAVMFFALVAFPNELFSELLRVVNLGADWVNVNFPVVSNAVWILSFVSVLAGFVTRTRNPNRPDDKAQPINSS